MWEEVEQDFKKKILPMIQRNLIALDLVRNIVLHSSHFSIMGKYAHSLPE